MAEATSTPFKITLPSGTKLYAITRTPYEQNGGVITPVNSIGTGDKDGSAMKLYTQVDVADWNESGGGITYAAPGTGSPKYYNYQGVYNQAGNGTWDPTSTAGAELRQEMAKFNAGKPNALGPTVNAGVGAVALATGTSSAGLTKKLFNPTAPATQPSSPAPTATADITNAGSSVIKEGVTIDIPISSANYRKKYGTYYYPEDLNGNKQDRIHFTMKSYDGSTIDTKFGATKTITRKPGTIIEGHVYLPIQPSISDNNSVEWSGGTLNAVEAGAAGASLKLIESNDNYQLGQNAAAIIGSVMAALRKKDTSRAMNVYFAQEAVGIQGLLSRTSGAVLNPNLELLFRGPTLRPFNFAFKMSPRSETEAKMVRQIIRFFKQGMAVKKGGNTIFLKSPNIFTIKYESFDKEGVLIPDHKSLNRIKECALLSCNVDYTPDGTYMTYNDNERTMTSYQITLQFSELDPIYESDYNDIDGIQFNNQGGTTNSQKYDSAGIGY